MLDRLPTAPLAATGLIAGYAVAVATGSRPLGGIVLALCGIACIAVWTRRDGRRTAVWLALAGLGAFALSHVIALAIGAWPAVLLVAAATFALYRGVSDSKRGSVEHDESVDDAKPVALADGDDELSSAPEVGVGGHEEGPRLAGLEPRPGLPDRQIA